METEKSRKGKRANRRYKKKHPEKVKACRIRYLDKKIRNNPKEFKKLENKFLQQFEKLTRLLFKDKLPRECSHCGAKEDLHIHHIKYSYPIKKKDLIILCRRCHIDEHQKIHPIKKERV